MRRILKLIPALPVIATAAAALPSAASASTTQASIFQDDAGLLGPNRVSELTAIKGLGASEIRVSLAWSKIATQSKQPSNPTSPSSYPAANWAPYDAIAKLAAADGIKLEFDINYPVPKWAQGPGRPGSLNSAIPWKPNAKEFGSFVKAVGTRYSGHFSGLPRVSYWSVWNEPNYGQSMAPETTNGGQVQVAANYTRQVVDSYYSALKGSGHGSDTILFGEVAPHGYSNPGVTNVGAPLTFIRAMYCVGSNYKPLTGSIARAEGCGQSKAKFRSQNPLLFAGKGFAAHLYAQGIPPNQTLAPKSCANIVKSGNADLGNVGALLTTLNKVNSAYGVGKKPAVWNTEYGFQTDPPETPSCNVRPVSQQLQAQYINQAEYISYKNPRIAAYDQYLLFDPPGGNFASGLVFNSGTLKASYDAYQIPVFMPKTTGKGSLEVWGGARPSRYGGAKNALVQYTPNGGAPVTTAVGLSSNGYFDTHVKVTGPGTVRVIWNNNGTNEISREVSVS